MDILKSWCSKKNNFVSNGVVLLFFLFQHVIGYAEITLVRERTPAVRDAIIAAVSGVNNPSDLTETHLAAITSLNLRAKGITALKVGDFSGMTGLTNLNLYNNELSSLPDDIFKGLTTLTTLRLGGNAVDPMLMHVSLEKVGGSDSGVQFKAVVPTGAPFAIVLPVHVTNGRIIGEATTLTIAKGRVESDAVTVTRASGTTDAVSANIGTLPRIPSSHYGYALSKSDTLPLTLIDVAEVDKPDTSPITPVEPPVVSPPVVTQPPIEESAAPVFTDGTLTVRSVAENTSANINIGTAIAATDTNNDALTYVLSGTDAAAFGIDTTSGQLRTKAALDYETKRFYALTTTVSDGSLNDTIIVIMRIIDVDDTPLLPTIIAMSERTPEVRDAIVAAVPGINDTADVTATHLAAITSLNLRNAGISVLKTGDFSGLTTLTSLNLYGNMLSSLPDSIFSGLNSLTALRLGGNTFDPLPLIVSLQQVGQNQYQAVIRNGAPFDVVVPISGASDGITSVTVFKGRTKSTPFTVMRDTVASIGDLPTLPQNHFGYMLTKSAACNRTMQVTEAVAAAFPDVTDCRNLTDMHLAIVTSLNLNNRSITSLQRADFAGMLSLSSLDLRHNQLSRLPDGIFSGLTSLTTLHLEGNTVDPLPLTVSLEKVGTHQIKAVIPSGAPFDMVFPISLENGSFAGNVSSLTVPMGSVQSMPATVVRTDNTYDAVTVDFDDLPSMSDIHSGYELVKSGTLPLEIFSRINIAPVFIDGTTTTRSVAENTAAGENIGEAIAATDVNDDTLTYTLVEGVSNPDAAAFDIVHTSGQLQTKGALDYETKNAYTVQVTVSDGSLSNTIRVTVNVTDVDENRAPVFTDGETTTRSVAENTAADENIGTAISATDADNDTLTFSLNDTDTDLFAIDTTTGQLKTKAVLDYETKNTYSVIITVSDGSLTDTIQVTINITDIDETPPKEEIGITTNVDTGTEDQAQTNNGFVKNVPPNNAPVFTDGETTTRSVAENTGSGVDIGTAVSATDEDGDTLIYELGGTDAASFGIDSSSGQLRASAALDYETKVSYSVSITVSDGNGGRDSITVTISVTDVYEAPINSPPEFADDSITLTVQENTASDTDIGAAITATDADGDTLTYSLDGTDASAFSIDVDSGQLKTNAALDFENRSSYAISVTASDGTDTDSISVTINVTNVNEAPVFSDGVSTTRSIAENVPANINIGSAVSASDPEGDNLAWTLGGTDAAEFNLDTETGQLRTRAALDYETRNVYSVTLTVSDGALTDTIAVTINVTDLDETPSNNPPVFRDGTSTMRSIAENSAAESNIGPPIIATDQDNNRLAYLLSGDDAAAFNIVSTTGQLITKAPLNHEAKSSYTVVVTVTDGSSIDTITVTIDVTDVNEVPVIGADVETVLSIPENTASGVNIGGTLPASDPDDGDTLTYSLGGTDAAAFSIVETSGQLQTKSALDYETKNTYAVTITVSDGALTDSVDITINVLDIGENRAPVFTDGDSTTRDVAENTGARENIGSPVSATDADNDDLTYTLSGTDAVSFSIVSTTGQLQTDAALDFETKRSYAVTITVSDGRLTDEISVKISVTDIDENRAPVFTDGDRTTREIAENTGSGVDIGDAVSATDADDDELAYTLGGTDASSFSINTTNGQLLTNAALDYETKTTYTVTISVSDANGGEESITVTINVTDVTEITTPISERTPQVRDAIVAAAGVNSPDDVTATHLVAITSLHLSEQAITSLKTGDFDGLTALTSLDLNRNQISDISVLEDLKTLTTLDLYGNNISDISSLKHLTNLQHLYLSHNEISDLSALEDLTTLQVLRLNINQISNITPLAGLTDLITLEVFHNKISNISPVVNLTNLTRLYLSYNQISDISPVSGLQNLTQLYIAHNPPLSDISVFASFTKLERITLHNCNISDISPLQNLTTLVRSTLNNNKISDISPLQNLTNIRELYLDNNQISDVSVFKGFTSSFLRYLFLKGNPISDYEPLHRLKQARPNMDIDIDITNNLPVFTDGDSTTREVAENTEAGQNIGTPVAATDADNDDLTYTLNGTDAASFTIVSTTGQLQTKTPLDYDTKNSYAVTITVYDGNSGGERITVTINVTEVVENGIAPVGERTPQVRDAIVHAAGVDSASDVTEEHLAAITSLDFESKGITSLKTGDFDGLTALTWLSFKFNNITDISPLAHLTQLTYLTLYHINLVDISPLENLTALEFLDLANNKIVDIAALDELTNLTFLKLNRNTISDISALAALTKLSHLNLSNNNGISDLSALADLTALTFLELRHNNVSDISVLEDLTALTTLSLVGNSISDISTLTNLTKLTLLSLGENSISDISPLTTITDLKRLNLDQNSISDIAALGNMTKLNRLDLSENSISDIATLENMTRLTSLNISENSISDIAALENMTKLTWLDLSENSISDISALEDMTDMENLYLDGNSISDISALAGFTMLTYLTLHGNSITDFGAIATILDHDTGLTVASYIGNGDPRFIDGESTARSVAENTESGQNVGRTVSATDPDGDAVSYYLRGRDADQFSIVSTTGQLLTKEPLDYETKPSYTVTVYVIDVKTKYDKISVTINVTDVDGAAPSVQPSTRTTALLSNFPNPFNPDTWIPYRLANASDVQITIYDVRGTAVRQLDLGHQQAGVYQTRERAVHWDGTNAMGEKVSSGIYFYQLQADNVSLLRKMLILQ